MGAVVVVLMLLLERPELIILEVSTQRWKMSATLVETAIIVLPGKAIYVSIVFNN